jgi:hypothetical protein
MCVGLRARCQRQAGERRKYSTLGLGLLSGQAPDVLTDCPAGSLLSPSFFSRYPNDPPPLTRSSASAAAATLMVKNASLRRRRIYQPLGDPGTDGGVLRQTLPAAAVDRKKPNGGHCLDRDEQRMNGRLDPLEEGPSAGHGLPFVRQRVLPARPTLTSRRLSPTQERTYDWQTR